MWYYNAFAFSRHSRIYLYLLLTFGTHVINVIFVNTIYLDSNYSN